jgi:glycosyltransferase involved in cell wall biosynthesis
VAYLKGPDDLISEIASDVTTTCLHRKGKFSLAALRNIRQLTIENDIELIICMNEYPLLYAAILKLFLWFDNLKVFIAINTTDFNRVRDRLFMLIYSRFIRRIDGVVYGCNCQRKLWQERYRLGGVKSRVTYNGVDSDYFDSNGTIDDLREQLGLADSFVVGCVGRLDRKKISRRC